MDGFWSGIDLFFCISGFVIAKSLIPTLVGLPGRDFWREVGAFWIKRCYRIIPVAWLSIVALAVFNWRGTLRGNPVFLAMQ